MSKSLESIRVSLVNAHKKALAEALIISRFNISKMAKGLGISRPTAYKYLLEFYGENFTEEVFKTLTITIDDEVE